MKQEKMTEKIEFEALIWSMMQSHYLILPDWVAVKVDEAAKVDKMELFKKGLKVKVTIEPIKKDG